MAPQQEKATKVRWLILAILFAVTTINYADRATIAIAGPELKKLLGLSPVQMGFVFSAFAWSYVLAQLPGGWLLDRFGSKITYFFSIFLWSIFTMLMGTVGFLTGAAAVTALFCLRLAVGAADRRTTSRRTEETNMATTRTAKSHWEGSLMEGAGQVTLESSGSGTFEVSWPSRARGRDRLGSRSWPD